MSPAADATSEAPDADDPAPANPRVLVLCGDGNVTLPPLREGVEAVPVAGLAEAIELMRGGAFEGLYACQSATLPLEAGIGGQQASAILNTIGEGVCIVGEDDRALWSNRKMLAWPEPVQAAVTEACGAALRQFRERPDLTRSRRSSLTVGDENEKGQHLELIATPVLDEDGQVAQVAAVVWDATGTRRLQQKIDAIDKAGRELVKLESEAVRHMNMADRLKLLEETVIRFSRDLLHFDHFAVRLLDRRTDKLELVISEGLPEEALQVELFKGDDSLHANGISGFVAATGRSYICPDVDRDDRYVVGLEGAKSSLTVPLQLHDQVIGVFNIESSRLAAFSEDDRQFAEIFGRYVAMALNILELMVVERVETRGKLAGEVTSEVAGPLNDIASDAQALMDEFLGDEALRHRLQAILGNVDTIRGSLKQAERGPQSILGAKDVERPRDTDPALTGARVLVVDDEPIIRDTIADVLRKFDVAVTILHSGNDAIGRLQDPATDRPDLILSDIRMPDKSGYDVFSAAKVHAAGVPVILMTGFGYDPNHCIVRASQEGLQAVLFKPFKVDQLLAEVRRALAHRSGSAA